MSPRSLMFRLGSMATALIVIALTLAGFGLAAIFAQELERRAEAELAEIVKVVAAQVRVDAQGAPALDLTLPNPRFDTPYGGLYWQAAGKAGRAARSRSLWDFVLDVPDNGAPGERHSASIDGPNGTRLLAVAQDVVVAAGADKAEVPLQVTAALDRSDLEAAQRAFLRLLVPSLAALGIILVIAMAIFIRLALRPFRVLGRGLQAIHAGRARALPGGFPDEVQPVVSDLNRLIAFQDAALDRARTQAGDLAHGLKTPLAVLDTVARQAGDEGRADLARPIDEQVRLMQHQVDRALARARASLAAALGQGATAVRPVADKVVRALARLPDTAGLQWDTDVPEGATFPGDAGDLTEILGNLIDNARKWARGRIRLSAEATAGGLVLRVEDDGPGLSKDQIAQIARGRRWDESQPGTGFGLAITRDLVESYGGALALDRSELGGLRATVTVAPAPGRA